MRLAVDASVFVLAAEGDGGAVELMTSGAELHAPDLVLLEVVNALRSLERAGALDAADVERAVAGLGQLAIRTHAHGPLLDGIWALRHNLSAYDASYLALAELEDLTLVTADSALAQVALARLGPERVRLLA